jgi:hypothetical protein
VSSLRPAIPLADLPAASSKRLLFCTRAQGDGLIGFRDMEDVSKWLKSQPRDIIAVVALRAALRAIPALETGQKFWASSPAGDRDLLQATFGYAAAAFAHFDSTPTAAARTAQTLRLLQTYSARLDIYLEQSEIMFEVRDHDFVAAVKAALACRLAYDAMQAEADASTLATGAIDAAMTAAVHAFSDFRSHAATGENALSACAEDARLVESGASPSALLLRPLWASPQPEWTRASWERLKIHIRSQRPDLEIWIAWYEKRLEGHEIPGAAEEGAAFDAPDLTMRPAMIEPVWRENRLSADDGTSSFDLGDEVFRIALDVLNAALVRLIENLPSDSNCDPRLINTLSATARSISGGEPNWRLVFELGHARTSLRPG